MIGQKRGDYHQKWVLALLRERRKTNRLLNRVRGVDVAHKMIICRIKRTKLNSRKVSRITRISLDLIPENSVSKYDYYIKLMVILNGMIQ